MLTPSFDPTANFATALLIHYSFDLGGNTAREVINRWSRDYSATWIRFAVIEALYQGRYKAISVEQILAFWQRRELALYHFNHEFERLVCDNVPQTLATSDITTGTVSEHSVNNGDAATIKASGNGAKVDNLVDPIPSAKNSLAMETQHSNQTSADQKLRRRSPPQASPSIVNHAAIEHFTPQTNDSGEFYTKLKVLAQRSEEQP
jgi:hypothetical protein